MENGEVYLNTLNTSSYNSWSDFFQVELTDFGGKSRDNLEQADKQRLPRKYASFYGIVPKMEKRSFTICNECKRIFHPKDILQHKNCSSRITSLSHTDLSVHSNCSEKMEDGEVYLNTLNTSSYNSWSDFFQVEVSDFGGKSRDNLEQDVQLLPRKYASLYGIIPKMEKRSFTICNECKHIFHPKDILQHKNCSSRITSLSHTKKTVKSKKKSPLPLPPLFSSEPVKASCVKPIESKKITEESHEGICILDSIYLKSNKDPLKITKNVEVNTSKNANLSKSLGSVLYVQPEKSKKNVSEKNALPFTKDVIKYNCKLTSNVNIKSSSSDDIIKATNAKSTASSNILKAKAGSSGADKSLAQVSTSNSHKRLNSINSIMGSKTSSSKSRKQEANKNRGKDGNLDIHSGVRDETSTEPSPKLLGCSVHLAKEIVPGRSNNVQDLIVDKNQIESPEKKLVNFRVNITLDQGQDKLLAKENEHKVHVSPPRAYITTGTEVDNSRFHLIRGRHPNSILKTNLLSELMVNNQPNDSNFDGQNVIYLPMSPPVINNISLNDSNVQMVRQHNSVLHVQPSKEPSMMFCRPIYFTIPDLLNVQTSIPAVKMYKTNLSPKSVHSYKAKKMGGAIMIRNARKLENQRKDILKALEYPNKNAGIADLLQSHFTS